MNKVIGYKAKHPRVALVGNGHGAIASYKSLQEFFDTIEIVTTDDSLIALKRESDECVSTLEGTVSGTIVCAGYLKIIPKNFLRGRTVVNTHPSLLPKYRGIHSLAWAMLNMEDVLGFTIHLVNEYIDDGDILEQYELSYQGQTSSEIMKLFDQYVERNLGRVVCGYLSGEITPRKQDKSKATWVTRRYPDDCLIDFNQTNGLISAMFKALVAPYPLPAIRVRQKRYEVLEYRLIEVEYTMTIGKVVNIEGGMAYIKTMGGLLVVSKLRDAETHIEADIDKLLWIGLQL